jgi:hypothetical protein
MIMKVGERGSSAVGLLAIPDAEVVGVGACEKQKSSAEGLAPVRGRAELVIGNLREAGGDFAAAVRASGYAEVGQVGDAREGLVEAFVCAIKTQRECALSRGVPVGPGRVTPKARAVLLIGSPVVAVFVEARAAQKQAQRAELAIGEEQAILAVDVGGLIDGAALDGCFLDVAVGSERACAKEQSPGAVEGLGHRIVVPGLLAAIAGTELGGVGCGRERDHVDHAADSARTIEVACAAADQLNLADGERRQLLPVNPAAEGIVEGHVVVSDQGAAGRS